MRWNIDHFIGSQSYITLDMRFQSVVALDDKIKFPHGRSAGTSHVQIISTCCPKETLPRFAWVGHPQVAELTPCQYWHSMLPVATRRQRLPHLAHSCEQLVETLPPRV
jgi:hypothetical protein